MTRNLELVRAVRRALAMSAVATVTLSGLPAYAQDQEQDQSASEGPTTIVVTGSRIARPELEASTPVLSLGQNELLAQGFENFADLAQSLPQFAPAFGTSRTQSTFSGVNASGLNTANLRNLGGIRGVVLINGRRVPGGTSVSTTVDFNTIPTANIERIEVQTGGASAIYGADAVTGVINIITKKNFEGVELNVSYGESSDSDNQNPSGHLMIGGQFAERGRGLLTLQYDKQGRVRCADRFICGEDFLWLTPSSPLRGPAAYSGVGLGGRFFTAGGSFVRRGNSLTDANGNLIPFSTPIDGYNRNAQRDIAIPTKRVMLSAEGEYELGSAVTAFAEVNYGQAEIDSAFEAHPFQSQAAGSLFGGGPGIPGLQATIPLNNPFVPQILRDRVLADAAAANPPQPVPTTITWWQRFAGFDNRGAQNDRETIRTAFGFNGGLDTLAGFGNDWRWELSYVYGRTNVLLNTEGLVGTDRLYHGLRVETDPATGQLRCVDPGARATGCVPINPFAEYTPAMINYLNVSAGTNGTSELTDVLAWFGGSIAELPAGSLRAVLGAEYREFSGFLDYDTIINQGLATGNQIGDVDFVKRATREAYVETVIPVLRDLPFAHSVNIEGAFRRSNTDGTDMYNTWKYGGDWAPIDGLRLRAMKARSVRTPVPNELSGIGQTFGVVQDPCTQGRRTLNATRTANCNADGVPANYTPGQIIEQSVAGLTGGNPDLQPEVGTTLTYGFVWTPSFVPDLSLTVDRFDLHLDGIITSVARQTAVNLCYDSVDRQFCNVVTRGTNPLIPGATYVLNAVNEQQQNVATYDVEGFDIQAHYRFGLGNAFRTESNLGDISLSALVTIYDTAEQVPLPGQAVLDLLGSAGGSTIDQGYIRRQGVFNVGYGLRDFSANWHMRYVGRAAMSPSSNAAGFPEIGSHMYHDFRAAYGFGEGSEAYIGVTNVFDKEPPFFASGTSGTQALDTIPGYYDVFGRSYYAGMRVRF